MQKGGFMHKPRGAQASRTYVRLERGRFALTLPD